MIEIAMKNSRPETEDGWQDGWTYPYGSFAPYKSTAWTTPIPLPFQPPLTMQISGCEGNQTELKWLDEGGTIIERWSLYNRTLDLTDPKRVSFVFCCPIEWKSTMKIEDVTHGKVIFENGKPWTELER